MRPGMPKRHKASCAVYGFYTAQEALSVTPKYQKVLPRMPIEYHLHIGPRGGCQPQGAIFEIPSGRVRKQLREKFLRVTRRTSCVKAIRAEEISRHPPPGEKTTYSTERIPHADSRERPTLYSGWILEKPGRDNLRRFASPSASAGDGMRYAAGEITRRSTEL